MPKEFENKNDSCLSWSEDVGSFASKGVTNGFISHPYSQENSYSAGHFIWFQARMSCLKQKCISKTFISVKRKIETLRTLIFIALSAKS